VGLTNGLFTVPLTFPSSVFDGSARWLDLAVRTNGSAGAYTTLSPRQPITAAPYAILASAAGRRPWQATCWGGESAHQRTSLKPDGYRTAGKALGNHFGAD